MALNVPVFFKRLGSAIVFVAIMLTILMSWHQEPFLILVCAINFLCLREYFRLMQSIDKESYWPSWLSYTVQIVSLLLIPACLIASPGLLAGMLKAIWGILFLVPAVLLLISILSSKSSIIATFQSIGGLFYVTLPICMLLIMRLEHAKLPLVLILMIWSNDTMAYLVGSFFGKHPFSSISPKKTWEGTIGGTVITIVASGIAGYYTHTFRIIDWIALSLCATIAGTLGDLLESKLKRMANVKDSGTLMPGHGGALDRFDSLLVATPFACVYVMLFMHQF